MLEGKWTYRSYRNDSDFVGKDAATALAQIMDEGVLDLEMRSTDMFGGGLGLGQNHALSLEGKLLGGDPVQFSMIGIGIAGTPTAGWRYHYHGQLGFGWPSGVDQIPSLVGTVVRVVAHGDHAPAGVTASFIAVQHRNPPQPRLRRRSALTIGL
ncbi:hypothetical protein SAMN03159338_0262 [Sphingomonas sp. NFR04]|uniref:hypothetical protein n=1 Tax=Sphingomonas sp. NFR04 TaxID=1566283 RepID=UPI0008E3BDB8|nr:hypothetical protein [Sphingomonas sp. NFR04]SFI90244.1 hypothetical protein SAMN03159338_0262 [Sphingomonas sp. NFR04]